MQINYTKTSRSAHFRGIRVASRQLRRADALTYVSSDRFEPNVSAESPSRYMNMPGVMISLRIFATCILAALGGGNAVAQTTAPAQKQTLLKASEAWNGSAYLRYPTGRPQLTTLRLTIAPHTALPWHTHPFPEVGYVASGAITIEDGRTGKHQTFRTGQAFAETVNGVHRGVTGAQPTVLIITYVGTPGVPTSIPARGAGREY